MIRPFAKKAQFSHFHHGVRWFYRIVFGFLLINIAASFVQSVIEQWSRFGAPTLPTLGQIKKTYLLSLAQQFPLIFWPVAVAITVLVILGYIYDKRMTAAQKASEHEHIQHMTSTTATKVLKEEVPDIVERSVERANVIRTLVKEEVRRERDNIHNVTKSETTMWNPPMDTHVLPLPPAASGLVGREEDQQWLKACIIAGKIVGVSGMGGVGKTTLVADSVNEAAPEFQSGGVAVVLANDVTNSTIILRQLVEKFVPNQQELLSRPDTKPNMLSEALSRILTMHHDKGNRVLIVIDSIEPGLIKDEGLEHLCNIFRAAKVSVVMTTREHLSARLVHDSRELEVFTDEAATNLLVLLLESFLHRSLSYAERHNAASICKIAGNHAQAIVLIVGYFEHHLQVSLATYLQDLRNSPEIVLDLTNRLQPIEAARGVRLTFASSYTQLEESAQHLFIALGALAGRGCTYQAVRALCAALNQSEEEILENLEALIRSKLVLKPSTGLLTPIERIHLHPLVQEFARELLRSSAEFREDTFYEALAAHYAEWVISTSEEVLREDDTNLIAALRWAKAHVPLADVTLAKLIYDLRWYWQSQFQFEEAFDWLRTGYAAMERLGADWHLQRGELMFAMGSQYQWIGDLSSAERCYKESYRIFREIKSRVGSRAGLGEALSGLAALAQQRGETKKAQRDYKRSFDIFCKVHDRRGEADALYRLGFLALRTGNIDDALRYYRDSLTIRLALGDDQWGEGMVRYALGTVFQQIGEIDNAQQYYQDSLEFCRRISNRRGEGIILKALGDLALQTSGPADAEKYLTQSHDISREIFDPQSESIELYSMGFLYRQTGRTNEAWECYRRSLEIRERIRDERGKGFTHKGLGDLARRRGDMTTAKKHLDMSLDIGKRIKDRRNEGVTLKALGDWAWQSDDMETARSYYKESLLIRNECRDLRGEAITLKALGDLALQADDNTTARDYLHSCLALLRQMNDQRGEGITLHSLAILTLEEGDKPTAQKHLTQSLNLIRRVQDRQSESAVLYTSALWAELRGDLSQAEQSYRTSLRIATEIQAMHNHAIFQETLGDFLIRRSGQRGRYEGDPLLVQAAETYNRIGRYEDARHIEERRGGRYKIRERDKLMRILIYDLDEGPNGQSFAVPNERRSARRSS